MNKKSLFRLSRLPRVGFNVRIRNRRFRKRNNLINRRPPNVSTRPQKYGPGRLVTNITLNLAPVIPNNISSQNLGELLKSNLEFTELIGKFNYFKLVCIKIILRPYCYMNSNYSGVFVLNWHGEPPGDLEKSDNAKYFGPLNNNNKVWKFIPPKMVIGTTNTDSAPVDLSQYINSHRFVLPAWFHAFHDFPNIRFNFIAEMVIETRGITMLPASSKLENIEQQLKIIQLNIDKNKDKENEMIDEMEEDNKEKINQVNEIKNKIEDLKKQLESINIDDKH